MIVSLIFFFVLTTKDYECDTHKLRIGRKLTVHFSHKNQARWLNETSTIQIQLLILDTWNLQLFYYFAALSSRKTVKFSLLSQLIFGHQEKIITVTHISLVARFLIFLVVFFIPCVSLRTISIHPYYSTFPTGPLHSSWAIHGWGGWVRKWLVHCTWWVWYIWDRGLRVCGRRRAGMIAFLLVIWQWRDCSTWMIEDLKLLWQNRVIYNKIITDWKTILLQQIHKRNYVTIFVLYMSVIPGQQVDKIPMSKSKELCFLLLTSQTKEGYEILSLGSRDRRR